MTTVALVVLGAVLLLALGAVLVIAAYSAFTVVRPRRAWRPEEWQEPAPEPEVVSFPNDLGLRIGAWLVPPPDGGPVVLICHGFGTNRREGFDVVPWLTEAGYGALLLDFQGHGESEGHFTTVGLREVQDFLAAVRFLQERFGPSVQFVALGISMGAAVAIVAAAQNPAIRAVAADSPFATLQRAVSHSFRVFFRLPPRVFTRPTVWFAERFTGGRLAQVQPVQSVGQLAPRPLLIVQGDDDPIVNPEDARLLYAAAGEPKELWQLPECGHVQARLLRPEEYRQRVLACFARGLRQPETPGESRAVATAATGH